MRTFQKTYVSKIEFVTHILVLFISKINLHLPLQLPCSYTLHCTS